LDRALPAENRLNPRQDIDAGRQTLFDQSMGDPFRGLTIAAGGENNLKIVHMFTKYDSFCAKDRCKRHVH
jgi:hypothetical protein